jgi:ERCC4-related helicase
MSKLIDAYTVPSELKLGKQLIPRLREADQLRQRKEVEVILSRLRTQPGVILADEVGMGKTFVALSVAFSIATQNPRGPVVIMVPANLVEKWKKDLHTFCELYVPTRVPLMQDGNAREGGAKYLRYGVARHSVEFLKLLDDDRRNRCHFIFLASGAMSRNQTDKWVRLALIAECLRQHGRGRAERLIQVKNQIYRFLGVLLNAQQEEMASAEKELIWQRLLRSDYSEWKRIYNDYVRKEDDCLADDPVPKAVARAIEKISLKPIADALEGMPVRARGGDQRVRERIAETRKAIRIVEDELWKQLLAVLRWKSPLLVMDEAHHLKNPGTALARTLQSAEFAKELRTGDGSMAKAFDRMLFLTATPFQLGHSELVQVLRRFGDVIWAPEELGEREDFINRLKQLEEDLNQSQRSAISFHRAWSRLGATDVGPNAELWWRQHLNADPDSTTSLTRAAVDAYRTAKTGRELAEKSLKLWIVRHNKDEIWPDTTIPRRLRKEGASMLSGRTSSEGIGIPDGQILPFFLAARSAVSPGKDLLGEALSSSYEAFRDTRKERVALKDEQEEVETTADLSFDKWYLDRFDAALKDLGGSVHPKVSATVRAVADLWESGEKVLVFAYYRHTCRALRLLISQEIEKRMLARSIARIAKQSSEPSEGEFRRLIDSVQRRFFDQADAPGRRALDSALESLVKERHAAESLSSDEYASIIDIQRRFLRAESTLVCCFPLEELDQISLELAVTRTLDCTDHSGTTWRQKFERFTDFIVSECSDPERKDYLDAASSIQTGRIRVHTGEDGSTTAERVLANVQMVTGETKHEGRSRLMLAFNTPFFPDILVCSEVMGEGVDLQRFCRHVIHHDLAWNPSQIEQRTGRIDRIGCKAEGKNPIVVCLPYIAGAADERQFKVMTDREQWFRVVMGQTAVEKLIQPDSDPVTKLPPIIAGELSFNLAI